MKDTAQHNHDRYFMLSTRQIKGMERAAKKKIEAVIEVLYIYNKF
jgi:hypothetical protein